MAEFGQGSRAPRSDRDRIVQDDARVKQVVDALARGGFRRFSRKISNTASITDALLKLYDGRKQSLVQTYSQASVDAAYGGNRNFPGDVRYEFLNGILHIMERSINGCRKGEDNNRKRDKGRCHQSETNDRAVAVIEPNFGEFLFDVVKGTLGVGNMVKFCKDNYVRLANFRGFADYFKFNFKRLAGPLLSMALEIYPYFVSCVLGILKTVRRHPRIRGPAPEPVENRFCMFCKNTVTSDDELFRMPCGHAYCRKCVAPSQANKIVCNECGQCWSSSSSKVSAVRNPVEYVRDNYVTQANRTGRLHYRGKELKN